MPEYAAAAGPMSATKAHNIRADFPLFAQQPNLAFLDTAASAQKPHTVLDAMDDCYKTYYANVHRGVYRLSQQSTDAYENTRAEVAAFIGAATSTEVVFTKSATESINLVAQTWGRQTLKRGDVILLSMLEHHANIVPWQLLREALGVELRVLPITPDGTIDLNTFEEALAGVKLLAVTQMSNVLGTRPPLAEMLTIAKAKGITTLVDGCQGIVHGGVNVQALGCDFYVFSAHKLYGPTGVGVLYGRKELLEGMPPYQGGGDMIRSVTFEKTVFASPPARFEAGTPNIVGVIGLGAAVRYLNGLDLAQVRADEAALFNNLQTMLARIPGVVLHGGGGGQCAVSSFTLMGAHPHDIGTILDSCGVAIRVGHHCAQPLMGALGVAATSRASLGVYSIMEDINKLEQAIYKTKEILRLS